MERLVIYTLSIKPGVKRIKKRLVDVLPEGLRIPQGRGLIYLELRENEEDKLIVSSTSAVSIKADETVLGMLKIGGVLKEESTIYHALNIQPLLEIGKIKTNTKILEEIEVK